jgi:hypothetical protein
LGDSCLLFSLPASIPQVIDSSARWHLEPHRLSARRAA